MPAARNRKNATRIPPEVIAQTTIGTSRIRPKVMRFGILKRGPGFRQLFRVLSCNPIYRCPRACTPGDSDVGGAKRSRPARAAINHLSDLVAFVEEARYAAAGVDIDAGNRMVELIKP